MPNSLDGSRILSYSSNRILKIGYDKGRMLQSRGIKGIKPSKRRTERRASNQTILKCSADFWRLAGKEWQASGWSRLAVTTFPSEVDVSITISDWPTCRRSDMLRGAQIRGSPLRTKRRAFLSACGLEFGKSIGILFISINVTSMVAALSFISSNFQPILHWTPPLTFHNYILTSKGHLARWLYDGHTTSFAPSIVRPHFSFIDHRYFLESSPFPADHIDY